MAFTVVMLNDFQIAKITFEDDETCYWINHEGGDTSFCVHSEDLVSDMLDSYYTYPGIHDKAQIVIYDKFRGRVVLEQHLSWGGQGIFQNTYVIKHTPGWFKPAPSA